MSNTEVGILIDREQPRDAIHIAVAPVCAAKKLTPGSPIAFVEGSNIEVQDAPWPVSVGIVDPFLRKPVERGECFWMWLHPNTITSLRHDWTHPAFSDELHGPGDKAKSEAWLREFLSNNGPSYESMIEAVNNGGEWQAPGDSYHHVYIDGNYVSVGGTDAHGDIPDEFWDHIEVVTGKKQKVRPNYFSCSC